MAHVNKVMRSINSTDGDLCVDIFQRPDGSFGFEEFRRDHEDARGWFPVCHYRDRRFASEAQALASASAAVAWLV